MNRLSQSRWLLSKRGLSLAEVLIALVVISLAVLATLSSQAYGLRALSVEPIRLQASEVTNRALIAAELALIEDFSESVARGPEADTEGSDFLVEVREEVERDPDSDEDEETAPPLLKKVTVITTWSGEKGRESFELWTVFLNESALAE